MQKLGFGQRNKGTGEDQRSKHNCEYDLSSARGWPLPMPCHHTRGPMARPHTAAVQHKNKATSQIHAIHICSSALPPPPRVSTLDTAAPSNGTAKAPSPSLTMQSTHSRRQGMVHNASLACCADSCCQKGSAIRRHGFMRGEGAPPATAIA